MGAARTLFEKVWASHVAFERLRETGRRVRRPDLTFATADHYVPTAGARRERARGEGER